MQNGEVWYGVVDLYGYDSYGELFSIYVTSLVLLFQFPSLCRSGWMAFLRASCFQA